jgi:hypothetical protein
MESVLDNIQVPQKGQFFWWKQSDDGLATKGKDPWLQLDLVHVKFVELKMRWSLTR